MQTLMHVHYSAPPGSEVLLVEDEVHPAGPRLRVRDALLAQGSSQRLGAAEENSDPGAGGGRGEREAQAGANK